MPVTARKGRHAISVKAVRIGVKEQKGVVPFGKNSATPQALGDSGADRLPDVDEKFQRNENVCFL